MRTPVVVRLPLTHAAVFRPDGDRQILRRNGPNQTAAVKEKKGNKKRGPAFRENRSLPCCDDRIPDGCDGIMTKM